MKLVFKATLLLIFFLVTGGSTQAAVTSLRLGNTIVLLPAPVGFIEVSQQSHKMRQFGYLLAPANNEFLAMYLTKADLVKIKSNSQPDMSRYIVVYIAKVAKEKRILASTFQKLKQRVRRRLRSRGKVSTIKGQRQLDRIVKTLRKDVPGMESIKAGSMRPIGIVYDKRGVLSYGVLTKYSTKLSNKPTEIIMVGSVTYLMVKNKLLNLYVFRLYKDKRDLQWVKSTTRKWTRRILRRNK